jgi:diguanylate cyclase (GGDEF)-like protein
MLRFDGSNVTTYGLNEGLPTEVVDQLALDPDGKVWVGSELGLARFDGASFRAVPLPTAELKTGSNYQVFAMDWQGGVFVGTSAGLLRFDYDNPSHYRLWTVKQGLPANAIDAIYAAGNGAIYFVSGDRVGLLRKNENKPEILPGHLGASEERIVAVLVDGQGVVWVRSSLHFRRYEAASNQFVADDAGIPKANDFGGPSLDHNGNLMLPTVKGLYFRNRDGWKNFGEKEGLSADAVFAAMEDREGAIWIGYGGRGFDRWPGSQMWSGWTRQEGLPDDVVWCELRDKAGRLWVGTNNGLAMWDASQHHWRVWTEKEGLGGNTVRELALGRDGAVWVLSFPGGLARFDAGSLTPRRITLPARTRDPSGMTVARDGTLWIGNYEYLKTLAPGSAEFRDISLPAEIRGATSHPVFAGDGVLWTSGRNGIARLDGKQWSHFTAKQGLGSNVVPGVAPVSGNEIWFRYDESLGLGHLRLDESGQPQLEHFGTEQGLRSNDVFLLGIDAQHRVWAGADRGVSMITPEGRVNAYSQADGLLWDDTSAGGFWGESDGTVLLGTSRGLARFEPHAPPPGSRAVPVQFTSALLGGKEQLIASDPAAEFKNRTVLIKFAALTFRDPEDVSCRYRLSDLESEFSVIRAREVRYASLPAGNYRFEVSCRAPDGEWSTPAVFAFAIRPAWWGSIWARTLWAMLFVFGVWSFIQIRTRTLERERHRLEEAVASRSAELAEANRELQEAALTDPLTGVRNRRFFQSTIQADASQAIRDYSDASHSADHRDLVFYLADIDHFKEINDRFGHHAGDAALSCTAERLSRVVRSSDILVRWGGEEFLIASRSADRREAHILAERILKVMATEPLPLEGGGAIFRTCSVGFAAFPWNRHEPERVSVEEVLGLVDRALYMAKNAGRNMAIGFFPAQADDTDEIIKVDNHMIRVVRYAGPKPAESTKAARETTSGSPIPSR